MKPWHVEPKGRFERLTVASRVLEGNPLGDPHERPLWVYLPPGVGYGAMVAPMLRPDVFGALASHAGDALFEHCYLVELARVARALRDEYDGSYERFFADFRSRPAFSKDSDDGCSRRGPWPPATRPSRTAP